MGKTSFIEAMPLRRLKRSVSSESAAIPEYQPRTAARLRRRASGSTVSGPTAPIGCSIEDGVQCAALGKDFVSFVALPQ